MFRFRRPDNPAVRGVIAAQAASPFTYAAVGATGTTPPAGFVVDHTRAQLGFGAEVFAAARRAIEHWQQFELGWLEARPNDTPIAAGQTVAVAAHLFGCWSLNIARIVYTIDDRDPVSGRERFGFAYGTLPSHVERGEERFLVERDPADDSVWYDILAFSRPRHVLAYVGYPFVRRMQKRFARDSVAAMQRAVAGKSLAASR